jgi:hypothetical protein
MHVYVYDSFLGNNKFVKELSKVETRITDLGLNGKILRLGFVKNTSNLVDNEIKRGAKSIIAVGNDNTVYELVNSLAGSNIPLGIIPIGTKNNYIANCLGIENADAACDVLSARIIETLDLGVINNNYFLSFIKMESQGVKLLIEDAYSIEVKNSGAVYIINLLTNKALLKNLNNHIDPQDGILKIVVHINYKKRIFPVSEPYSTFSFKNLRIDNKKHCLNLNDNIKILLPAFITVEKSAIKLIVGKSRAF